MTSRSRIPFYIAIFLLIAAGVSLAVWRHIELGIPWFSGEQEPVWMVEARIDFNGTGRPVLASLNVPDAPPGFRILSEQAASPGYGFSIVEEGGNRRAEWSKREVSGPQTLYFKVQLVPDATILRQTSKRRPKPEAVFWEEPQATAVDEILEQARSRSSTPQSLTRELIKLLQPDSSRAQNTTLLVSEANYLNLLSRMLNHAGIPARTADGLYLEDARRRQNLKPFLQIFDGSTWLTFNPRTAEQGLPDNVLLWRQAAVSLLDLVGGDDSEVSFSMLRQTIPALQLAQAESSQTGLSFLSLYQLPIEEQGMFRMLLLLPLGALIVAFMRIVVGIRTSGTFMPILIAVAFVQTTLVPGLIAFVSVVSIGLLMRGYLSSLNLLLVSRISALIILVIFITAGLSIAGYHMGFNTGMTVTFFPMVIIAWTIERMSILWEEEGVREVFTQGAGSLFVAVCAFLAMSAPIASHLTFNFPELHLVVLGLILLMGQYTGYKLSELPAIQPHEDLRLMGWISPFKLNKLGMLNMNRRNVDYISRYNNRASYPLVDNKLKTKLVVAEYDIPTPKLLQVVRQQHEISGFKTMADGMDSFAVKPAKGSGGKGITVIIGRDDEQFVKASGALVPLSFLERHLSNILAGLYSLGGSPDVAIVEDLVQSIPGLARYSFQGVPDIRIVVFQGYPVMAMLRLATKASDGKANLHQGAIGVGLNIGNGHGLNAVQFNRPVTTHPDMGLALENIVIENWDKMLAMAARCYEATGLGYMGVDLVVDARMGPLLLELNARPGLAIQMANGCGLLPRLKTIESLRRPHFTPDERVKFVKDAFGASCLSPPGLTRQA